MQTPDICSFHQKPYAYICTSPQCFNFRLLCETCYEQDLYDHPKVSIEEGKQFYKKQLSRLKESVKDLKEEVANEIDTIHCPRGFNEFDDQLVQILALVMGRFDHYRKQLRDMYSSQLSKRLQQLYFDLEESELLVEELYVGVDSAESLSKVYRNDINYQIKYIESYLKELLDGKSYKMGWAIDDDKVLRLVTNFENNLKELLIHATDRPIYSSAGMLHLIRDKKIYKRDPVDNKLEVDEIDKVFEGVVQSISYEDNVYIFGQGNRTSKSIFMYDEKLPKIKQIAKMTTQRKNMSVCLLQNQMYIIGGENDKEGCLRKCQKYNPKQDKVYLINSLTCRSSHHSTHSYRDRYIFKFGGVQTHLFHKKMCKVLIEVYHKDIDQWKKIDVMGTSDFDREFTYLSGVVPGRQNQFIVFGGCNYKNQLVSGGYLVDINYDNHEIGEIKVHKESKYNRSGKYFGQCISCEGLYIMLKLNSRDEVVLEQHNNLGWNEYC